MIMILECGLWTWIIFFFMCWSKNFIFCILPAVGCELSNEMHSSRSSAMKQTARQAIGTECQSHCCGKMFGTVFAFDQHRCSAYLRGTACSALPNETRVHVTAAPRPSMSTAVVERRTAKRTRGGGRKKPYFAYSVYVAYFAYWLILRSGLPPGGRPDLRYIFFDIFHIFKKSSYKKGGCPYCLHIGHITSYQMGGVSIFGILVILGILCIFFI
jgi:hypothetical protein